MGFWVFMLASSLATPAVMIGFGIWLQKHPPEKINMVYGYRTKMSMKNMQTWKTAHLYFGKQWKRVGWCIVPATLGVMAGLYGQGENAVGIGGAVLISAQMAALLLPIWMTERELRRKFDADGNPVERKPDEY